MPTTATTQWKNHTRAHPCPICGKPDRCQYTADGAQRCFRSHGEVPGFRLIKTCRDGTGVYRVDDGFSRALQQVKSGAKRSSTDWNAEHQRFRQAVSDGHLDELAAALGVTAAALRAIGCGLVNGADLRRLHASGPDWEKNPPEYAYSLPERAGDGSIIGLSLRAPDGRKGAPRGSKRGLIIPDSLEALPTPVLIVEGASDVCACLTMGLSTVGRPSNSGGVEHLVALLQRHDVLVVGENDDRLVDGKGMVWPGRDGAISVSRGLALAWNRPVRVVMPPKPHKDVRAWLVARTCIDPAERARAGHDLLQHLLSNSQEAQPPPPELKIKVEAKKGRSKATVTATLDDQVIHVDEFSPQSHRARALFAKSVVAKNASLGRDEVEAKLMEAASGATVPTVGQSAPPSRAELLLKHDELIEQALDEIPSEVIDRAEERLVDPALINHILDDIERLGVVGERPLALSVYILGVSRLLTAPDRPLSAVVQGLSSSGKSHVIEKIGELFPAESVLRCTDLTPQSLFYLPPGRLLHALVLAGERSRSEDDEQADAKRALREMISAGRLSKAVPAKINGQMQTVVLEQEGPIAFIESTTLTTLFDEDANRCLLLSTDESPEQTKRVIRARASWECNALPGSDVIIDQHHALQRLLKRATVKVPFAERLGEAIPHERPEARRGFSHTLNTIKGVTLLHQRQRSTKRLDHGDVIYATLDDYRIARRLLMGPLARALGGALPEAVANLANRLIDTFSHSEFTTTEAVSKDSVIKSKGKMGQYLRTLEAAGLAELVEAGNGNKPHTWLMLGEPPEQGAIWLPEADALEVRA